MRRSAGRAIGVGLGAALGVLGQAAAQDRPLSAGFEEVYRVGGANAPEWAFFEGSSPTGFDAAGNLYVLDRQAGRVVVIDPRGGLLRTIGRKGQGPGELNRPMGLAVWRDGRLVVSDLGHAAYQIFAPDGELERFVRVASGENPLASMGEMNAVVRPYPGGEALIGQGAPSPLAALSGLLGEMLGPADENADPRVDDRGLERIDLATDAVSFTPVLQAWRAAREEQSEATSVEDMLDPSSMFGMMMGKQLFFEPRFFWDLLPDGSIAYSDSSAYAVKFAEPGGPATDALSRPIQPEPVTRRIRSATVERALRRQESDMNDPRSAEATAGLENVMPGFAEGLARSMREEIENREFHPEVPVVRDLRATWEGRLWIQRRGEEPWDDEGPIDVFGTERRYVGTFAAEDIEMPEAFGPDGLVAYWEFDELDVPTIVVRRLPAEVR